MEKQKKNELGITLIALVISIIVMLILAGVSLNATVGENGIVTRAQEAKEAMDLAQIKEDLEYMFLDFNIDESENDIAAWLEKKKQEGLIDDFKFWKNEGEETFSYLLSKDGKQFYVAKQGDYYYATETQTSLDSIGAGIAIVTQDSFDASTGNMSFELNEGEKSTMYFAEEVTGEFNFEIKGGTVDIYITQDMNLTNEGLKRSAIDIYPNATLNLHIAEGKTLNVNSGLGEEGVTATALGATGGPGGYAGIHVPKGATLKLHGSGTVIAYGGNAGAGGGAVSGNTGGGGGGGAGAGIGGNGGEGGRAGTTFDSTNRPITNSGTDGKPGTDCGDVYIYDKVIVCAYGGNGGAGGMDQSHNSGAGGGGYPGAGIGGGGAGGGGGDHACSSGGYTAGSGETNIIVGKNGSGSSNSGGSIGAGSGYYSKGIGSTVVSYFGQGGIWSNNGSWYKDSSGSGGEAGAGGKIYYSEDSKIYAYNGNRITEENFDYDTPYYGYDAEGNLLTSGTRLAVVTRLDGKKIIPAFIYAQSGTIRAVYKTNQHMTQEECTKYGVELCSGPTKVVNVEISTAKTTNVTGYSDTKFQSYGYTKNQGIGSGAGYVEKSNGELTKL